MFVEVYCNECDSFIETIEYTKEQFSHISENSFSNAYCNEKYRAFHTDRDWLINEELRRQNNKNIWRNYHTKIREENDE